MTTNELIATMTDRIARDFDPLCIILFGSHARGDARCCMNDTDQFGAFSIG